MNTLSQADILVLIDVQYGFIEHTQRKLLYNLTRLTRAFRNNNKHICLVEYADCGLTHSKITELIDKYNNKSKIIKYRDSAGQHIFQNFQKSNVSGLTFHVAGVNWSQCVFKTTQDLLKYGYKVTAHKYASNPSFRRTKLWESLPKDNLTILDDWR